MFLNNFLCEKLLKKFETMLKNLWFHPESSPSRCYWKSFSTQTDWFYSYQCNKIILFKSDN